MRYVYFPGGFGAGSLAHRTIFCRRQSFVQSIRCQFDGCAGRSQQANWYQKKIEALRDQFPNFDDERWGQARELISGWVDELGATSTEKGKFIAEIRVISAQFPPEQRTQAIDAFYRLKKDKLLSNARSLQSWATQFGTRISSRFARLLPHRSRAREMPGRCRHRYLATLP